MIRDLWWSPTPSPIEQEARRYHVMIVMLSETELRARWRKVYWKGGAAFIVPMVTNAIVRFERDCYIWESVRNDTGRVYDKYIRPILREFEAAGMLCPRQHQPAIVRE